MRKHSWRDPHMVRAGKSILLTLYSTLGIFLFLFSVFHLIGALYVSEIAKKANENFQKGISADLSYLKEQGDLVATNDLLQQLIIEENGQSLVEILQSERSKRGIGLMSVTNSEGVILSRTKSSGTVGDNVFLTNPVARVVAGGKSAESVEAPVGFSPEQVFLNTGRPVIRNNQMIGALFASYLTDDEYASRFQDKYLPAGVKIVFYNNNGGVYGNGFSDPETRKLVKSYFNSGSEYIQDKKTGTTISLDDGNLYLVENIIFPGLETSPGGALLFIPRGDFLGAVNISIILLTVLIFIILVLRNHMRSSGEERGWRYYVFLLLASAIVFVLALVALRVNNESYTKLKRIPYPLYNATMRVEPEYGVYDLNFERNFSVVVDTGDEGINAVQFGLVFDPSLVEIKEIKVGPGCSYVVENKIEDGIAKLACVMFQSSGEKGSIKVADVLIKPKNVGKFSLTFDSGQTKVLASDGLGTDVLRMTQPGSYTVDKFDQSLFTASPSISTSTPRRSFVVFSTTHPNQSKWYNTNNAKFVWRGKLGAVYKYAFDNSPNTIPSNLHTTQDTEVIIPIPGDGIFYFHLQPVSGGPIAHYRVQVDRTPPSIATIKLSQNRVVAGDVLRITFNSEDVGSGIQKNYYIDLGNRLFLPTGSELFVPFFKAGEQKIILRVYDSANNYSEKTQVVRVEPFR